MGGEIPLDDGDLRLAPSEHRRRGPPSSRAVRLPNGSGRTVGDGLLGGLVKRLRETDRSGAADGWSLDDRELLARCRVGDDDAFAELCRRYLPVAIRIAAAASHTVDPEDVVADALVRIWRALRAGGGPEEAFGAYLRVTIRNVASTMATRSREDAVDSDQLERETRRGVGADSVDFPELLVEHATVTAAFNSLPERWQSVLWQVDVEGRQAAEVGRDLGLTANATAALTKRARDALARAWLQQHVERDSADPDCEWVLERAGGFVRRSLAAVQDRRVRAHLEGCPHCERAVGRVAHLATYLRVAAMVAGGSAAGIASWSSPHGAVSAAAATIPESGPPVRAGRGWRWTRQMVAIAAGTAAALAVIGSLQPMAPSAVEAAAMVQNTPANPFTTPSPSSPTTSTAVASSASSTPIRANQSDDPSSTVQSDPGASAATTVTPAARVSAEVETSSPASTPAASPATVTSASTSPALDEATGPGPTAAPMQSLAPTPTPTPTEDRSATAAPPATHDQPTASTPSQPGPSPSRTSGTGHAQCRSGRLTGRASNDHASIAHEGCLCLEIQPRRHCRP